MLRGGSHCPCSRAVNTSVQDAHVLCSRPVFIGIVCTDPWPRRGDISRTDLVRAPLTSTEVDLQREPAVVTTCILIAIINCDINCHDHLCTFAVVNSAITKNCFVVCRTKISMFLLRSATMVVQRRQANRWWPTSANFRPKIRHTIPTPQLHHTAFLNVVRCHTTRKVLWCWCGVPGLWTKVGACGPPYKSL